MNNQWVVKISFLNLDGKLVTTIIKDVSIMNILSSVDMVPTAKIISVLGERKAA